MKAHLETMRDELIDEVSVDGAKRLFLTPRSAVFDDLHMAGAFGFRWDADRQALAVPELKEWTCAQWFRHIVAVISQEYGIRLVVVPETRWKDVPQSTQDEIRLSQS